MQEEVVAGDENKPWVCAGIIPHLYGISVSQVELRDTERELRSVPTPTTNPFSYLSLNDDKRLGYARPREAGTRDNKYTGAALPTPIRCIYIDSDRVFRVYVKADIFESPARF